MMITEFIVATGERAKRLDAFLVNHERKVSRSRLQRLIMAGRIRVNAYVAKPSQKIKPGDRITMDAPKPGPLMVDNKIVPLEFLYEDEALVVVNKPAGVVVHPTSGNWNGTLLNGLLAHFQSKDKAHDLGCIDIHPGLVHRLDKETSGVMVVAKTDQAHRFLCRQFEKQAITRIYEALVYGRPPDEQGSINLAIGRDAIDGKKVSTHSSKAQAAVTEFKVVQQFGDWASHVELIPCTGRQHQLRVHMASLGCPILGDPIYSGQKIDHLSGIIIPRMMLHARYLWFQHPTSKRFEEYTAAFPSDMQRLYEVFLEKYNSS